MFTPSFNIINHALLLFSHQLNVEAHLAASSSVWHYGVTESAANSTENIVSNCADPIKFCNEEHKNAFQYLNFASRSEIKALCCWWSFIWKLIFGCTNETRARKRRADVCGLIQFGQTQSLQMSGAQTPTFSAAALLKWMKIHHKKRRKLVSSFFPPVRGTWAFILIAHLFYLDWGKRDWELRTFRAREIANNRTFSGW